MIKCFTVFQNLQTERFFFKYMAAMRFYIYSKIFFFFFRLKPLKKKKNPRGFFPPQKYHKTYEKTVMV